MIVGGQSNRCIDVPGASTTNGAQCLDANGQGTSNGTITGVQSGLCLDASGLGTTNGTLIHLWTCHGRANQQWSQRS